MSDKELLHEIVEWIVVANKSQLPYDFHAKAIHDLVREYYGKADYIRATGIERQRCIDALSDMGDGPAKQHAIMLIKALEGE